MQETLLSILQPTTTATANATSAADKEDKQIELLLPHPCHLVAGRPRSQPSCRRVTPTRSETTTVVAEKVLPNGDIYTGTLSGSVPHGKGKYLWSDGCMYEGEWKRGRAYGKGKFSWPSGATYEGQFKDGRMHGYGTFIGVDGDSYKGNWLSDRKHGFGEKRYGNGDVYEGWWRSNLQDGEGKYRWSNGNEYAGEWRHGVIHGKGVLVWANGNRYEGHWENGVPKGKGAFTFANRNNRYDGNFKEEPRKRLSVDANFPRICIWELDGEAGDITCDIVDNVEASSIMSFDNSKDSDGNGNCKDSDNGRVAETGQCQRSPCSSADGDVKKPGQTISKGHKNYDLMLNLQLGIRYSVGKHDSLMRELRQSDFDPKEKYWTRFPPEGSKFTAPHQSVDFKWKDYCPMVFRHLRELFAIDPADYMVAICGNDALREFSSPGKSGSFFYLTQDDRFMIKTVKKSEVKGLKNLTSLTELGLSDNNISALPPELGLLEPTLQALRLDGNPLRRFLF